MLKRRYESFHVADMFPSLVVWGSSNLPVLDHVQHVPIVYAMLETHVQNLPGSIQRAKTLLFPTEEVKALYTSLMPPEKLFVGPLQQLY